MAEIKWYAILGDGVIGETSHLDYFCTFCGAEIVVRAAHKMTPSYDRLTGRLQSQMYELEISCPSYSYGNYNHTRKMRLVGVETSRGRDSNLHSVSRYYHD